MTARTRALALAGLLPPVARFVVRGALDEMTEQDIIRTAQAFELLARWVHCSQQHHSPEVTQ